MSEEALQIAEKRREAKGKGEKERYTHLNTEFHLNARRYKKAFLSDQYWSFSFSIIPSKEIPGLISFRMDWLDLLAVKGTLKSLLQHHSSKASILQFSASFMIQLSHPYITTGKTIALTRQIFVSKVMSLLFNMLSRLSRFSSKEKASFNFMAPSVYISE